MKASAARRAAVKAAARGAAMAAAAKRGLIERSLLRIGGMLKNAGLQIRGLSEQRVVSAQGAVDRLIEGLGTKNAGSHEHDSGGCQPRLAVLHFLFSPF